MLLPLHRIIPRQVPYHFRISLYHSERCSQVVRYVRNKVFPKLRYLLYLVLGIVKHRGKLLYLTIAMTIELHRIIPFTEFLRRVRNVNDRL